MKIFFDIDDCIFDTQKFFGGIQDIFEEFGISRELSLKTYQEIKAEYPQGRGWCYSFEAHIERLKEYVSFDEDNLQKKLETYISDTRKFLFADVENLVVSLKKSGHSVFILSFGDLSFQKTKISGAGILPYIEKIIITDKGKAEALKNEIGDDGEDAWFFDDKIYFIEDVKRAFPKIKTVLVQREESGRRDEPNEFCDYVVKDFDELFQVLKNI